MRARHSFLTSDFFQPESQSPTRKLYAFSPRESDARHVFISASAFPSAAASFSIASARSFSARLACFSCFLACFPVRAGPRHRATSALSLIHI